MRTSVPLLALLLACARPAAPAPAQTSVDARRALAQALDDHWQWTLRTRPELASLLGDRRYSVRWTDSSPEAEAARVKEARGFLRRFEEIDPSGLSEQDQLNRDLLARALRQDIERARFEPWLMPLSPIMGVHVDLPQIAALLPFESAKDYADYAARLRALPALFEQVTACMRAGMARKLMPPRFLIEKMAGQAAALAGTGPEASPFAQPVAHFPDGIAAADQTRLRADVLAALREDVLPAYAELARFLRDDYAPRGRIEAGVWSLPDGDARYAFAVREMTTTAMTADEIHQLGLREVARIEADERAIAGKLGFPDLASLRRHIRASPDLHARSRQDILDRYRRHAAAMERRLPELFRHLPEQKLVIEPIEEYREKEAPGAQYIEGARDGSRPGIVRVNTGDATQRLIIDIESTAYHEGVPGHHLQMSIQQSLPELPPARQRANVDAFSEGWGLYAERLAVELGFYRDPYSNFGRLQDEKLRAIRLVVDTGLHARRWTRDQVVAYFRDHSSLDEPTIQSETDRYIAWPGQALSYKVGELTIERLRERARAELGHAFDIRAFHDHLLGAGALPLDILEQRMTRWIANERKRNFQSASGPVSAPRDGKGGPCRSVWGDGSHRELATRSLRVRQAPSQCGRESGARRLRIKAAGRATTDLWRPRRRFGHARDHRGERSLHGVDRLACSPPHLSSLERERVPLRAVLPGGTSVQRARDLPAWLSLRRRRDLPIGAARSRRQSSSRRQPGR